MREFLRFLREEKRWWLTPIIVVLIVLAAVIAIVSLDPELAPFVYPGR